MKKYSKLILILSLVLSISIIMVACEEPEVKNINIKSSYASLVNLVDKEDSLELEFNLENGSELKLIGDKEDISNFIVGDSYSIAYNPDDSTIIDFARANNNLGSENPSSSNESSVINRENARVGTEDLNLIDTVETIVTDPDKEDHINLYSTASRDEAGNLILDDGQVWKLIVHTDDGDFILFDDYVQGSPLYFYVFTENDDLVIVTVRSGTANLNLEEYRYDKDKKNFIKNNKYEATNDINMIYSN